MGKTTRGMGNYLPPTNIKQNGWAIIGNLQCPLHEQHTLIGAWNKAILVDKWQIRVNFRVVSNWQNRLPIWQERVEWTLWMSRVSFVIWRQNFRQQDKGFEMPEIEGLSLLITCNQGQFHTSHYWYMYVYWNIQICSIWLAPNNQWHRIGETTFKNNTQHRINRNIGELPRCHVRKSEFELCCSSSRLVNAGNPVWNVS